jgi:NTP pyrophosphatase (non-canonical NTP hydrolase)
MEDLTYDRSEIEGGRYVPLAKALLKTEMIDDGIEFISQQMKIKMSENMHKPGWRDDNLLDLLSGCQEEVYELYNSIFNDYKADDIIRECADVANFVMMIADVVKHRNL